MHIKDPHVKLLALALLVIGLGTAGYRYYVLGFPLLPAEGSDVWTVEARVGFTAKGRAVKAEMLIPSDPPGFAVLDEKFVSKGYGLTTDLYGDNRIATWTVRRANGEQVLYYRLTAYNSDTQERDSADKPEFPDPPQLEEPFLSASTSLLADVREKSADIATFTSVLLKMLNDPTPSDSAKLFLSADDTPIGKVRAASTLLAGARIPTRIIHVLDLSQGTRNLTLSPWLEVHTGQQWMAFNPENGARGLPPEYLVWARGDQALVRLEGASEPAIEISAARNVQQAVDVAVRRSELAESRLMQFSLFALPVQTQNVYRILLLVPLGALIIVLLRNVVGIKTFGTFMPVLIALAFRETELAWGIVLFSVVVALGLAVRFYLEHLKLLLVPRLAAVVTIVVLLMLTLSIFTHKLGLDRGISIALFPMVILAMTIERMSIVWEERGAAEAISQGLGSLAVAALSYLAMSNRYAEHLMFVFPDLLFVVLAATLLLGRYSGYRLTELRRFRVLARNSSS